MKIVSYNISGGFYIGNEDTEYLDREAVDNIDDKLLKEIIDTINKEDVDILCLQEVITTSSVRYLNRIMDGTKLKYYKSFELSPCNIVKDTNCGVAILSKYEITSSIDILFPNPKLSKTTSSGNTYYTYDKGMLYVNLLIDGKEYKVITHHGFPYRRFNGDAISNRDVFNFFDNKIKKLDVDIITGDFNTDNFMDLMNYTSSNYIKTVDEVTTVDGCKFDNVLLRKDTEFEYRLERLLSDHFMIIVNIK